MVGAVVGPESAKNIQCSNVIIFSFTVSFQDNFSEMFETKHFQLKNTYSYMYITSTNTFSRNCYSI